MSFFAPALVSARPQDAQQPQRQQTYLRALATLPDVSVHLGHYLTTTVRMPLVHPAPGGPRTVEVLKTEEKGSDVNLATYLLLDAFWKDCDTAVVISNDSDLAEPIRVAETAGRAGRAHQPAPGASTLSGAALDILQAAPADHVGGGAAASLAARCAGHIPQASQLVSCT